MKIILALWLDFKKFYFFTHYLNQIDFTFDILPALQDQKEKNICLIALVQAQYFGGACVLVTNSALLQIDWTCT